MSILLPNKPKEILFMFTFLCLFLCLVELSLCFRSHLVLLLGVTFIKILN